MSATESYARRGFYRDADRAVLGGVCAGIAGYLGFNLRVLRILAIIAFIVALPMTIVAYLAAVLLIPSRSGLYFERVVVTERGKPSRRERRRERREAKREARREREAAPRQAAREIREKCQTLDQRIADLEKHITSSRYQLDREIRNL